MTVDVHIKWLVSWNVKLFIQISFTVNKIDVNNIFSVPQRLTTLDIMVRQLDRDQIIGTWLFIIKWWVDCCLIP